MSEFKVFYKQHPHNLGVFVNSRNEEIISNSGYEHFNIGDLNSESFDTCTDTDLSSSSLICCTVPNNSEETNSSLTEPLTHMSEAPIVEDTFRSKVSASSADLYTTADPNKKIPRLTIEYTIDDLLSEIDQPNTTGHIGRKRSPRLDKFKKSLSLRNLTPKRKKMRVWFSEIKENFSKLSPRNRKP